MLNPEEKLHEVYTFCAEVFDDGIGDFNHLHDIVSWILLNKKYEDIYINVVVLSHHIGSEKRINKRILEKLKLLVKYRDNVNFAFACGDPSHGSIDYTPINSSTDCRNLLKQSSQFIYVSLGERSPSEIYYFLNQQCIKKMIREHESEAIGRFLTSTNHIFNNSSMGMGEFCLGIKIKDPQQTAPSDDFLWNQMIEHDNALYQKMLSIAKSPEILRKCPLIPAYFNKEEDFLNFFLARLIVNESTIFDKEKNLIFIHYSGSSAIFDMSTTNIENYCITNNIGTIEVHTSTEIIPLTLIEIKGVEGAPTRAKKIIILSGFYLSEMTYNAIYENAKLAGVSGDNTFEMAVSNNAIPFYLSTNEKLKLNTLATLRLITQDPTLVPNESTREAFQYFFDNKATPDSKYNFEDVYNAWQKVSAYLYYHYNFYEKLDRFILEDLPIEKYPTAFQSELSNITTLCGDTTSIKQYIQSLPEEEQKKIFNLKDPSSKTMLHYAANKPALLELFLNVTRDPQERMAAFQAKDLHDNTLLHYVRVPESVDYILRDCNKDEQLDLLARKNKQGRTPITQILFFITPFEDRGPHRLEVTNNHNALEKMLSCMEIEDALDILFAQYPSSHTFLNRFLLKNTEKCIDVFISRLTSENVETKRHFINILNKVNTNIPIEFHSRARFISAVISLLNSEDILTQEYATKALYNLAENEANKDAIREAQGISALISLLNSEAAVKIQQYATDALLKLSVNHTNKDAIREARGIPALISLFTSSSISIQCNAFDILKNLLSENPQNKSYLCDKRNIATLISLLNDDRSMVKRHLLDIFLSLHEYDGGLLPSLDLMRPVSNLLTSARPNSEQYILANEIMKILRQIPNPQQPIENHHTLSSTQVTPVLNTLQSNPETKMNTKNDDHLDKINRIISNIKSISKDNETISNKHVEFINVLCLDLEKNVELYANQNINFSDFKQNCLNKIQSAKETLKNDEGIWTLIRPLLNLFISACNFVRSAMKLNMFGLYKNYEKDFQQSIDDLNNLIVNTP